MQTKEDRFALAADDIRGITIEVSVPFQHVQKPGLRFLASGAVNARKLFKRGHDGTRCVSLGSVRFAKAELRTSAFVLFAVDTDPTGSARERFRHGGKKAPQTGFPAPAGMVLVCRA